jgi:non-specific serine/threonine protein kinase/serine/threonine-protein kinase
VLARPDTIAYRAGKFFGRNKAVVITAALSAIGMFGSGIAIAWQAGVAESRRQEATKRFNDLRQLTTALVTEIDKELERLSGSTHARELLVERVLRYLDTLAKDDIKDTSLQRELAITYERLADVQGGPKSSNLGNSAGALESYNKALAIYERLSKNAPSELLFSRDTARAHSKISDVMAVTGDNRGALEFEQKALAVREAWLARHPDDPQAKRGVATSLQEVATDLDRLGEGAKVAEYRRKALQVYEELFASGVRDRDIYLALALAHKRLGRSLHKEERYAEAIPHFDKAAEFERELLATNPVNATALINLSFSYNDKARALFEKGDYKAAIHSFADALKLRTDLVKGDPQDVRVGSLLAATQFHMGVARVKNGEMAAGLADLQQSLASREKLAARDPKNLGALGEVAQSLAAIGDALALGARRSEAVSPYQRAHAIYLDLRERGRLSAEFAREPDRIAGELAKLGRR